MAIPVYLWLEDDGGAPIKGNVDVSGREGSIEVTELMHSVEQPTDPMTCNTTAKRLHSSYSFMKGVDNATCFLYKALSMGQTLKMAVFKFYRINDNGQEEEYFRTTLENVKVTEIESTPSPVMVKHTQQIMQVQQAIRMTVLRSVSATKVHFPEALIPSVLPTIQPIRGNTLSTSPPI